MFSALTSFIRVRVDRTNVLSNGLGGLAVLSLLAVSLYGAQGANDM